jgi:hypothetical protein
MLHTDSTSGIAGQQSGDTAGAVAVAFLRRTPGIHQLVALNPFAKPDPRKRKPDDTEGLDCTVETDADRIRDWINARNGRMNLYWTVNEVRSDFAGKKPSKSDIASVRYAHLDVDLDGPNTPEALHELYEKIRKTLPDGLEPTMTIASGGGYQLVFALPEPIRRTGDDVDVKLAIEAQNRGLISLFDGDASTWNMDRLLRLPGTDNVPNAKKLAMGRVRAKATLVAATGAHFSLAEIAAKVPPVSVVERASTEPEIAATWAELDGGYYEQCCSEADLPEETEAKRVIAAAESLDFRDFWENGTSDIHGRKAKMAALLAWRSIDFTAEQYAQLMWCWGFKHEGPDYCEANLSARSLARAYANIYLKDQNLRISRDAARQVLVSISYEHLTADASPTVAGLCKINGPIDALAIPQRQWVVYPRLPRGDSAQVVGEPGVSKSSHTLLDALAIATGDERLLRGSKDIGFDRLLTPGNVMIYNAEDRLDDMRRRMKVLMDFHGITDLKHDIYFVSGIEAAPLVIMERKERGMPLVRAPGATAFENFLKRNSIVHAVLDPQISLARGGVENDTDSMNDIMQELANIASRTNCCILTVQHTSKMSRSAAGDAGAARGAFSQVGKIRSGYTLVKVDPQDAVKWGFDPSEKLIRMDYSKNNHAAVPDIPIVLRRHSGRVGNGNGFFQHSADPPFDESSAERFAREGDSAPYLEIVGLGVAAGTSVEAAPSGPSPEALKRIAVAQIVADALGGQAEGKLREMLPIITKGVQDAGFTKSDAIHIVTGMVTTALSGAGQLVEVEGQSVRLTVEKRGPGDRAPWFVVAASEGLASLTSLAKNSVFE